MFSLGFERMILDGRAVIPLMRTPVDLSGMSGLDVRRHPTIYSISPDCDDRTSWDVRPDIQGYPPIGIYFGPLKSLAV